MRSVLLTAVLSAGLPAVLAAQNPGPQAQGYTLSTGTRLVVVDVTAHDRKGNPVRGLKAGDFTLEEDGRPQTISSFEEHSSTNSPAGSGVRAAHSPGDDAVDILLLDRLNTARPDQAYLAEKLRDFARHAPEHANVAVFGLTSHLILLKDFSASQASLESALKLKPATRPLNAIPDTPGADTAALVPSSGSSEAATIQVMANAINEFNNASVSYQAQARGRDTLDALNQLGSVLARLPGRKNLIWFAGEFPPDFLPQLADPHQTFLPFAGLDATFRKTIDLLTVGRVAVYTVDVRGVMPATAGLQDVTNTGSDTAPGATAGSSRGQQALTDQNQQQRAWDAQRAAMETISRETGGQAQEGSNDLAHALQNALKDGADFYTLTYVPPAGHEGLRSITVRLNNGDKIALGYRRGYYATAPVSAPAATVTH